MLNIKKLRLWRIWFISLLFLSSSLLACSSAPQLVEVTRVVQEEVPVTVEVAQITTVEVTVEMPVTVEVPVEVTRLVEVMVTPTAEPTAAATAVPTNTPEPTATETASGNTYTVQTGDTLASIAVITGVSVADIVEANGLSDQNFLQAGQALLIPGWDGVLQAIPTVISTPTVVAAVSQPTAVAPLISTNLLPNASFEDDWYFFNNINELQLPIAWSAYIDEGANTLTADPDDVFFRPEIRVITASSLPANESTAFIFNGQKTIKAFKGGAPTSFAVFTDIALPAGTYRFTMSFFPDIVSIYNGGTKVWATDPDSAEARVILNDGGTAWATTNIGTKNTVTYEFSLTQPATVRLGGAFRNRYVNSNNGWFLDDWSLYQLGG